MRNERYIDHDTWVRSEQIARQNENQGRGEQPAPRWVDLLAIGFVAGMAGASVVAMVVKGWGGV